MSRSKSSLVCVLLACAFAAVHAGEEPAPATVVREKTVYVPYEKLKEIFEKEGRGIFLPYEEFLELWRKAHPAPPEPPPDEAPAPAVIRGGTYTGSVSNDIVRFTVTFQIDALKKGWSEIAIPLKGVALENVTVSRPDALFSAKGDDLADRY